MDLNGCINLALRQVPLEARPALASSPIEAVRDLFDLQVHAAEHLGKEHGAGGVCDGMSFLEDGVLLYAPTPNSRRQNFTILHELGHWLIDQEDGVLSWLADQDEPEKLLETMCDHLAQKLLLHGSQLDQVVRGDALQARHLMDLYAVSQASRPACAIGLASRLTGLGAVVIIDSYSRAVQYSSVRPDPAKGWPAVIPWPGHVLTEGHPLARLTPGTSTTARMEWETPWGDREHFYVDAVADEQRVYAVFSATDLWGSVAFHPYSDRQFDQRLNLTGLCCGREFETRGYPCGTCSQPYCPTCKCCKCDREAAREQACSKCYMNRLSHLLKDGVCVECRE
jgi:hypothetical protein